MRGEGLGPGAGAGAWGLGLVSRFRHRGRRKGLSLGSVPCCGARRAPLSFRSIAAPPLSFRTSGAPSLVIPSERSSPVSFRASGASRGISVTVPVEQRAQGPARMRNRGCTRSRPRAVPIRAIRRIRVTHVQNGPRGNAATADAPPRAPSTPFMRKTGPQRPRSAGFRSIRSSVSLVPARPPGRDAPSPLEIPRLAALARNDNRRSSARSD